MSSPSSPDPTSAAQALLSRCGTVILSTLSPNGWPEPSVTPCLVEVPHGYVFLSRLAPHTENLLKQPRAGVLWVEDEGRSRNLFARERLSAQCEVETMDRESPEGLRILDEMQARFGSTVDLLRGLPDFILFRLTPTKGRYIRGFGAAFAFDGFDLERLRAVEGR